MQGRKRRCLNSEVYLTPTEGVGKAIVLDVHSSSVVGQYRMDAVAYSRDGSERRRAQCGPVVSVRLYAANVHPRTFYR
jgi:hypothetical protein